MSKKGPEYHVSPDKRNFDLMGGLALAGIFSVASLPAAAAACVDQRTLNPFFKQERVGYSNQLMQIYKFISLSKKAKFGLVSSGSVHPDASSIGVLMRRLGIDEIPQILNVIKGEISLVGIRPLPQTHIDYLRSCTPEELFSQWFDCYGVNLGLTGPGQLYGKKYLLHTPDILRRKMEIEITATENASLKSDMLTIIQTPVHILKNLVAIPTQVPAELNLQIAPNEQA